MELALPKFILLKQNGNNKYLHYRPSNKEKGSNDSFLHFNNVKEQKVEHLADLKRTDQSSESEKTGFSWNRLRFEVEKAKTVEGFVHIRTCYNNKYWVRNSEESNVIVAEANEPEEDLSKWSCTLFKPIFVEADDHDGVSASTKVDNELEKKMCLLHAGQRSPLTFNQLGDDETEQLIIGSRDDSEDIDLADDLTESSAMSMSSVFTVINEDSTPILPDYLTIMGSNDQYLVATSHPGIVASASYFETTDVGVAGVAHKVKPMIFSSKIIVQSSSNSYAWGRERVAITGYVSYVPVDSELAILCVPVNVGNLVAFRNTYDNTFLTRDPGSNAFVYYNRTTTITKDAMFKIGEPVLQREIIDATYDLDNARVYNVSSLDLYTSTKTNNTDVEQNAEFKIEYKVSKTKKWNHSVTVNIGISVKWSQGIPVVGDLGVEISYGKSETWDWGEENTEETTVTDTQNTVLKPMTKTIVKVVATKAYCDVPFTCNVRDTMTDGSTREYTMFDCMYVGSNEFGFDTTIDKVPI